LAEAARALDEAVARLEQASQARAPADPSAVNQAALAEAAARIDALILRLNDAAAKPRG
jgi:alkylation response protein AidB-like acyl-CoA dehydrogenase